MRTAFRWWRPGFAMLALLSTLGLAGTSMADTTGLLRGKRIIFVEPYGPGSATNLPVALLQAELASKTGASRLSPQKPQPLTMRTRSMPHSPAASGGTDWPCRLFNATLSFLPA